MYVWVCLYIYIYIGISVLANEKRSLYLGDYDDNEYTICLETFTIILKTFSRLHGVTFHKTIVYSWYNMQQILYCTVTSEKAARQIVTSVNRKWPHREIFSTSSSCCMNLWIWRKGKWIYWQRKFVQGIITLHLICVSLGDISCSYKR